MPFSTQLAFYKLQYLLNFGGGDRPISEAPWNDASASSTLFSAPDFHNFKVCAFTHSSLPCNCQLHVGDWRWNSVGMEGEIGGALRTGLESFEEMMWVSPEGGWGRQSVVLGPPLRGPVKRKDQGILSLAPCACRGIGCEALLVHSSWQTTDEQHHEDEMERIVSKIWDQLSRNKACAAGAATTAPTSPVPCCLLHAKSLVGAPLWSIVASQCAARSVQTKANKWFI